MCCFFHPGTMILQKSISGPGVLVLCLLVRLPVMTSEMRDLGCVVDGDSQRCFTFHFGTGQSVFRTEASKRCNARVTHLADVDTEAVSSKMNINEPRTSWIRLRLHNWNEWRYVVGGESASVSETDFVGSHGCAYLDTDTVQLMADQCNEPRPYICNKSSHEGAACNVRSADRCFTVGTSPKNWYAARYSCVMDHDGDLAAVTDRDMAALLNISDLTDSWVGASNGIWGWKERLDDPPLSEMLYNNWRHGHPESDKDCAVVDLSDGLWNSVECNDIGEYYICENDTVIIITPTPPDMTTSSPHPTTSVLTSSPPEDVITRTSHGTATVITTSPGRK